MRLSFFADTSLNVLLPLLLGVTCYAWAASFPFPVLLRNWGADALWAYALLSALLIIWERRMPLCWGAAAFALAILYEAGQWAGLLPGTADFWDLFVYATSFSITLLLNEFFQKKQ